MSEWLVRLSETPVQTVRCGTHLTAEAVKRAGAVHREGQSISDATNGVATRQSRCSLLRSVTARVVRRDVGFPFTCWALDLVVGQRVDSDLRGSSQAENDTLDGAHGGGLCLK